MPLLGCDAAQLEWRCCAELSRDEVAIKEIVEGQDTHSLNQAAFGLPSRLIAKIYLFRTIFRGSGWSFANDPDFMHVSSSPKYWDSVNEKFFGKYKGIDKQHNVWKDIVMSGKPIIGPLGRGWEIEIKRDHHGEIKVPWTTLTNFPVQGSGADVMMIARISAYNRIKKSGLACRFISTVHDSILCDVPKENLQQITDIFHQVFDDVPTNIKKLFGYEWVVPMNCECKFGPNMKDMSKIERQN